MNISSKYNASLLLLFLHGLERGNFMRINNKYNIHKEGYKIILVTVVILLLLNISANFIHFLPCPDFHVSIQIDFVYKVWTILDHIRSYYTILDHFGPFVIILYNLRPTLSMLDHCEPLLAILVILHSFGLFVNHIRRVWTRLDLFGPI